MERKHFELLKDEYVRRWYENLAVKSVVTQVIVASAFGVVVTLFS